MLTETRFSMLARSNPERSKHLLALAQADADERWRYYSQLADWNAPCRTRTTPRSRSRLPTPRVEPWLTGPPG